VRVLTGWDGPTSGAVTVSGLCEGRRRLLSEAGAVLDAKAVHGGRTGYTQVLSLAQRNVGSGASRLTQRGVEALGWCDRFARGERDVAALA
jgi:ABC-2 type transport system ATP-binding protein